MAGVLVLGTGLVVFIIAGLIGLTLTLTGFASCRKRETERNPLKVWLLTCISTILILSTLFSLTLKVSSGGAPTMERYEEMTKAIALWALVPGIALVSGGIALFTLRSKQNE